MLEEQATFCYRAFTNSWKRLGTYDMFQCSTRLPILLSEKSLLVISRYKFHGGMVELCCESVLPNLTYLVSDCHSVLFEGIDSTHNGIYRASCGDTW